MTVTAPPRPPRPSDPVDREELEALVKALIEEARRRARRRRQKYAAFAMFATLVAVGVTTILARSTGGQSASLAFAARTGLAAGSAQSKIAFVSVAPGGRKVLYVMNADGSGRRKVSTDNRTTDTGWPEAGGLAWSADARRIAYSRGYPRRGAKVSERDIFVAKVDGSGGRRLTRNGAVNFAPAWSPDGQKILFQRSGGQLVLPGDGLYVMNADGSSQRRVARHAFGGGVWSPDGRKIAFLGNLPGLLRIYVMNADGSGKRNLTHGAQTLSLVWSPDGRRIAFVKWVRCWWKCQGNSELWVMNADGSEQRRVAKGQQIVSAPSWSLDGRTLVYESSYRPSPNNPKLKFVYTAELFRVNVDGSGKRRLAYGAQPAWSPDGEQILFVGRRHSKADLWVMNADGSGQRRLTRTPGYGERTFAWSP